jgi:hypothetical protein
LAHTNGKPVVHGVEQVAPGDLKPHPQNYRGHPDDQRAHLVQSIREHGFYRNVIVAKDGTILAGHGVVEAAIEAGLDTIPVVRLTIASDAPQALKLLAGDNEVMRLASIDDRKLADLLRDIRDNDIAGLLGTGYDDQMLANLVFVTRPSGEIAHYDDAAAWVGLPSYENVGNPPKVIVSFDSEADRERFIETLGIETLYKRENGPWSFRWPPRPREDLAALRFEEAASG